MVVARWQVRGRPGSGTILVRESVARAQATGKSYEERVDALSRALAELTSEIAAALPATPRAAAVAPKSPR